MLLLTDFHKSVVQLFSGKFFSVLLKSLALTVLLLLGVGVGLGFLGQWFLPETITLPWIGEIGFIDEILSWAALPAIILLSPFLIFPVAAIFIGLFLDEIAGAVEAVHYPKLTPARSVPVIEALIVGARFGLVFLLVNGVAMLVYVVASPLAPFVFWAVNGYLLGREYFNQVALRRMPVVDAGKLRRRHRLRVWFAGVLMAVPLSIPIVNLVIPLLGVATFTHQFQRLRKTP